MGSTVFKGDKVATLKDELQVGKDDSSAPKIINSTTDPTAVAVSANPGSLLLNRTTGKIYRKNDSGSSTNWEIVRAGAESLMDNVIQGDTADTKLGIGNWQNYKDAAAATPEDGTGPSTTLSNAISTDFDGAGDYGFILVPSAAVTTGISTGLSCSAWVKWDGPTGADDPILQHYSAFGGDKRKWYFGILSDGRFRLSVSGNGTGANTSTYFSTPTVPTGKWIHLAATWDGATETAKLYMNGVEVAQDAPSLGTSFTSLTINTAQIQVGGYSDGSLFYNGLIDESSLWNKALSAAEVAEIFNNGVPEDLSSHSAVANLAGWWRCGDGDAASVLSDQVNSNDFVLLNGMDATNYINDPAIVRNITAVHNTTAADLLDGPGVLEINKEAYDAQGEGAESQSLAVPIGLRGKQVQLSFDYKDDGNYVNNYYRMFAYDITNGALLNVLTLGSDGSLPIPASNGSTFYGTVDIPSTCAAIRVVFHATGTSTVASKVYATNFRLGRINTVNGATVKNLTAEITGSHTGGGAWEDVSWTTDTDDFGTFDGTTFTANKDMTVSVQATVSFASNNTGWRGIRILPDNGATSYNGSRQDSVTGVNTECSVAAIIPLSAGDTFKVQAHSNAGAATTYSTNSHLGIQLVDNGALLSTAQADLRTLKFSAYLSGVQTITANTGTVPVEFDTIDYSTHGAGVLDVTTNVGRFVAPFASYYKVRAHVRPNGVLADSLLTASIISTTKTEAQFFYSDNYTGPHYHIEKLVYLAKGEEVWAAVASADGTYTIDAAPSRTFFQVEAEPDFSVFGVTGERNKIQTKVLTVDIPGTADTDFLEFTNLVVGKTYRYSGQVRVNQDVGDAVCFVLIKEGATTVKKLTFGAGVAPSENTGHQVGFEHTFVATETTVKMTTNGFSALSFVDHDPGGTDATWATIEELNNFKVVSEF